MLEQRIETKEAARIFEKLSLQCLAIEREKDPIRRLIGVLRFWEGEIWDDSLPYYEWDDAPCIGWIVLCFPSVRRACKYLTHIGKPPVSDYVQTSWSNVKKDSDSSDEKIRALQKRLRSKQITKEQFSEAAKNCRDGVTYGSVALLRYDLQSYLEDTQPIDSTKAKITEDKQAPPASIEKAYQSYCWAECESGFTSDKEVYSYLTEHPFEGYDLPAFDAWKTYVSKGRTFYGTQKNTPRAGRSVRAPKAIDNPGLLKEVSNQYNKN